MPRFVGFDSFLAIAATLCLAELAAGSNSLEYSLRSYGTLRSNQIRHQIVPNRATPLPYDHVRRLEVPIDNRFFVLELIPATEVFASNFKVFSVDGQGKKTRHRINPYQFYRGKVYGENYTDVIAHVDDDDIVTATVWINNENETFHIESAARHFSQPQSFHMITYKGSDVKFNFSNSRYCDAENNTMYHQNFVGLHLDIETDHETSHLRRRREIEKNSCGIALVADYRFYRAFGRDNEPAAAQYLINIFVGVEKRYRVTDWGDGYSGLGFVLQKVIVHTEPYAEKSSARLAEAPYNDDQKLWDSRKFLDAIIRSQQQWNEHCIVHVFTHQDFPNGLLGLAPIASRERNKLGGMCSPPYSRSNKAQYTNVGYSTGINWNKNLVLLEQQIVMQHELGHNWGSPHDSQSCQDGNAQFIMSPSAVGGNDPRNFEFSSCSKRSVLEVLKAKSSKCFVENTAGFCGNKYRETGEECDGGALGGSSEDQCCNDECHLKSGATCSDENDVCCRNCSVADSSTVCFEAEKDLLCRNTTYCNGSSSACPSTRSKNDGSACIHEGKCQAGQCVAFCESVDENLTSCTCENNECVFCCKTARGTCLPYDEVPGKLSEQRRYYTNGTVCSQGTCQKGVCEEKVQDTVPRFWDSVKNFSLNTVVRWIRDNIVASVLLFTAILWIPLSCIVHHFDKKRKQKMRDDDEDYAGRTDRTDGPLWDEDETDQPDNGGMKSWRRYGRGHLEDKVFLVRYKDVDHS